MASAAYDDDVPFLGQGHSAAAVICRTPHGNIHLGLLHRTSEGEAAVLHLGWQDLLINTWEYPRLWAAPDVEPERLRSIAGICRQIWRRYETRREFPYALRFDQTTFTPSGQLKFGGNAQGLTCATFVLAVFNSAGVRLVDDATWPERRDDDQEFLAMLSKLAGSDEHRSILRREVEGGCRRIKPQEVIGACEFAPPVSFVQASEASERILRRLDERR